MPDREKVIRGLECCSTRGMATCELQGCQYYSERYDGWNRCTNHLAADALSLLKEQEAVEPHLDVDEWKCGNCGHDLEHQEMLGDNVLFHEQYNYCPNCGKPVKWE